MALTAEDLQVIHLFLERCPCQGSREAHSLLTIMDKVAKAHAELTQPPAPPSE